MADEKLTPKELLEFLSNVADKTGKAWNRALLRTMPKAELQAKKNVKENFPGRNNYRLTGGLLNSISHGFSNSRTQFLTAFLQSSGIPYNAIHEFGGEIKPQKANNLWIKNHDVDNRNRTLTPREFMAKLLTQRASDEDRYAILRAKSSKKLTAFEFRNGKAEALFFLRKKVNIPARPYLEPAMVKTGEELPAIVARELDSEFKK